MSSVNKILLPRRAKKSVMKSASKSTIILEKGELFVEASDDGIGKGHAKFKIGDGSSRYSDLDYALGDTSNDEIEFEESTETNIETVIGKIITNTKLGVLITSIKRVLVLLKGANDDMNTRLDDLTDDQKITEVVIVNSLPADAASHPTTVYLIKSS